MDNQVVVEKIENGFIVVSDVVAADGTSSEKTTYCADLAAVATALGTLFPA